MDPVDESFIEEFKPVHVPHKYEAAESWQDKVIFSLAELNNGTIAEVSEKLHELEPDTEMAVITQNTQKILIGLYDKGLLKAVEEEGHLRYNLSKNLEPHTGKTDV
ncbi:hypothetical protein GCM10023149_52000 [Mucilaginibacter gynuensis]|uniref:Uncharacterized protein n=1 Tax=Mucilaginibacter gynuensis TaxID=1302236 RepID=A0ABP8HKB1_9SPHI